MPGRRFADPEDLEDLMAHGEPLPAEDVLLRSLAVTPGWQGRGVV